MNMERSSAVELALAVARGAASLDRVDVGICPAFVHIDPVAQALRGAALQLAVGGQDLWHEPSGAFTGEVSAGMLLDAGASLVIVGHSERRHIIGESDELIGRKAAAALSAGLTCIVCIGETEQQRTAGQTDAVNERQLRAALADIDTNHLENLVIAYEPVWAIGTGKTATPDDAQAAHAAARAVLADLLGDAAAQRTRIQYGGSMKPANAAELMACPDIDGGLIGGASLKADDFLAICQAAQ